MSDSQRLFQDALTALNGRKLPEAERFFKAVLQREPEHVPALNLLTVVLMARERFNEAEEFIARAVKLEQRSDVSFYNYGLISKHLGKSQQALEQFTNAARLNAGVAETWNNRGTVFNELKRYEEALSDFGQAISLNPNYPEAFANKAKSLSALKRYDDAIGAYDQALALRPDLAEAWLGRADVLRDVKRYDASVAAYEKALALRPELAEAWLGLANVRYETRHYDHALLAYDKALALKADLANAWLGRGNVLYATKHRDDASVAYDRALALRPDLAEAWVGRGNVFTDLPNYGEAEAAYDKALSFGLDLAEAWLGRGNVFYETRRPGDALDAYDKALALKPGLVEAWLGRGNVLTDLSRYDEALAAFDHAGTVEPDLADAWLGRGNVLFAQNRDAEALACFDKSLALDHELADGYFNKSLLKLSLGEYPEGWPLYEWRWKTRASKPFARHFRQPLWLGETELRGETILIHFEQGFGDTINFSGYLPLLKARDCNVVFEVQKSLAALFDNQKLGAEVVAQGDALPPFDIHCPLLSLPLVFGTTVETISAAIPRLHADARKCAAWNDKMGQGTKRRIGLVWSGNPNFRTNARRSIGLEKLLPIITGDHQWYSLQKDVPERDRKHLNEHACLEDLSERLLDFADTAAAISQLDLVISVDTSVAHLAGALGKPVWILLSFHADFRWLRDRDDSPWYPTARLFRQDKDGEWGDVVARLSAALSRDTALL